MCLHVTVLLIHTFFILLMQVVTFIAFKYPTTPHMYEILIYARIAFFTTQSISMGIVIYLFV